MTDNKGPDRLLAAYCGLYCGACSFKRTYDDKEPAHVEAMPTSYDQYKTLKPDFCPGCRGQNQCGDCSMSLCAKERGCTTCADCPEQPCKLVQDFSNDDSPHHSDVIENLENIKRVGVDQWLVDQDKKWTCSCGQKLSWYLRNCPKCEKECQR